MRAGVLKVVAPGGDAPASVVAHAAGEGDVPAPASAGRGRAVVEFAPPPGPVEPPLPLVDGVPPFRMSRAMLGGLALLGDATVLAGLVAGWLAVGLAGAPALGGAAALLLAGWVLGQYGRDAAASGWRGAAAMALAGALGALAAAWGAGSVSWGMAAAWCGAAAGLFAAWRVVLHLLVERWRRDGHFALRVAVLGGAGTAALLDGLRRQTGTVLAGMYEAGSADQPAGRLRWPDLWRDAGQGRMDAVVVALP